VGFPSLSWKRYRLRATACGIGNGRGRRVPGFGRCSARGFSLHLGFCSGGEYQRGRSALRGAAKPRGNPSLESPKQCLSKMKSLSRRRADWDMID
jgi:hypothetical protein